MTNKQYEQLRQVIINANPSILELDFGCKVKHKRTYKEYTVAFSDGEIVVYIPTEEDNEHRYDYKCHYRNKEFKIIGRDIKLADVLIAIENPSISYRYFYKDKLHIQIEKKGKLLGIWELNKPLQGQSDETINFLHNLICK